MKKKLSKASFADASTGLSALKMGDYATAEQLLGKVAKANRRDQSIWVNWGIAQQALGDIDTAAITLSRAAAMAPMEFAAARPLQALVARYEIADPASLDAAGLKAALRFTTLDRQPLVTLAIAHAMSAPDLSHAMALCRQGNADQAAEDLTAKRTARGLSNDLLLDALRRGKNTDPDVENLLSALRRYIVVHCSRQRLSEDRALFSLLLALIAQLTINDHVWPVSPGEQDAINKIAIDKDALFTGNVAAACDLCLTLLYRPLAHTVLAGAGPNEIAKIRPKSLAALLGSQATRRAEETRIAATLPHYGTISDDISQKVAGQYEHSPYPRWTSLQASKPGSLRAALGRYIEPDKLVFMDAPFDVLIAGCGTGQQAARAASGYGDAAKILAIDLSKASLAYGKRMAAQFELDTIEFAQADILDAAAIGKTFDIIESVGVLHHMAEPFKGWQVLVDLLKPGGLMYIGLYSALARANITALRAQENWPSAGCSDDDARDYRAQLMQRGDDDPSASLLASLDFYSLNEFRDLLLHESEQQMSIGQIADFIKQSGLIFRGFTMSPHMMEHFSSHYPHDPSPGRLENWEKLENSHPSMFNGMYLFWCEKAS